MALYTRETVPHGRCRIVGRSVGDMEMRKIRRTVWIDMRRIAT